MVTCLCAPAASQALATASTSRSQGSNSSRTGAKLSSSSGGLRVSPMPAAFYRGRAGAFESRRRGGVVCMAPEEEKMTRRSPLDFPIEWERPKPGRRPDIFPKFSPMKTPLPTPMPADPPEEDEEEEEEKKEEEEDPEKEEEETEKPQSV